MASRKVQMGHFLRIFVFPSYFTDYRVSIYIYRYSWSRVRRITAVIHTALQSRATQTVRSGKRTNDRMAKAEATRPVKASKKSLRFCCPASMPGL